MIATPAACRMATLAGMGSDGDEMTTWAAAGREDLLGELQSQVARGLHTAEDLATAIGKDPREVADALGWGVSQGLVTRSPRPTGDWFELTQQGAASLAFRQSVQRAMRPGGRVDVGDVVGDMAEAAQAAEAARRRQQEQEEAHLLVGPPEREAAVTFLNDQYARGTLDLAELERRNGLALAAHTRGDLAAATADLGWAGLPPSTPTGGAALPLMTTTFTKVSPLLGGSVAALLSGRGRFVLFGIVGVVLLLPMLVHVLVTILSLLLGH